MSQFWQGFTIGVVALPLTLVLFAAVIRTLGIGDVTISTKKDEDE